MHSYYVSRTEFIEKIYFFIFFIFVSLVLFNVDFFKYSSLNNEGDRFYYIDLVEDGMYEQLVSIPISFFNFVFEERVWSYTLVFLDSFFGSKSSIFFVIPFVITILISIYYNARTRFYYLMFLLHPISFVFNLNQLRLAFAISIFLFLTIFLKNNKKLFFCSLILCSIHTSIIIFVLVYFFSYFVIHYIKSYFNQSLIFVFFGLVLSFFLGPFLPLLLSALGDRRALLYATDDLKVSLFTCLYSFLLMIFIVLNVSYSKSKFTIEMAVSIIFLSMVSFSFLFPGGYPFRYLSAVFPILIACMYKTNGIYKVLYYFLITLVAIYMFVFTLNFKSLF